MGQHLFAQLRLDDFAVEFRAAVAEAVDFVEVGAADDLFLAGRGHIGFRRTGSLGGATRVRDLYFLISCAAAPRRLQSGEWQTTRKTPTARPEHGRSHCELWPR